MTQSHSEVTVIDRQKYVAELGKLLSGMAPQDREAVLRGINARFDAEGDDAAVIASLGSPTFAAVTVLRGYTPPEEGELGSRYEPEPEPVKKEEPALSPEVQAIIDDGKRAIKEMGRLYTSIKNNDIRRRINELMRISDKIVQDAVSDPSDVPQIRKFLDYYLPTTIKLLNAYDRMSDQGIEGENLSKSMSSIEDMLDTAIDAFKKQLDSLFANQALDIETDISVMNQMLAREGLSDEGADTIIKAARSGKTE